MIEQLPFGILWRTLDDPLTLRTRLDSHELRLVRIRPMVASPVSVFPTVVLLDLTTWSTHAILAKSMTDHESGRDRLVSLEDRNTLCMTTDYL